MVALGCRLTLFDSEGGEEAMVGMSKEDIVWVVREIKEYWVGNGCRRGVVCGVEYKGNMEGEDGRMIKVDTGYSVCVLAMKGQIQDGVCWRGVGGFVYG